MGNTFTIWASDANYCHEVVGICNPEVITITIDNDNRIPIVQANHSQWRSHGLQKIQSSVASLETMMGKSQGLKLQWDLASGIELNNGPDPITSFQPNGAWMTYWDTSNLIHDQQYEVQVKAYDGVDYSVIELSEFR